jgi:hypothetical protein
MPSLCCEKEDFGWIESERDVPGEAPVLSDALAYIQRREKRRGMGSVGKGKISEQPRLVFTKRASSTEGGGLEENSLKVARRTF